MRALSLASLAIATLLFGCGSPQSASNRTPATPAAVPVSAADLILEATIPQLQQAMTSGELSSLQLIDYYIERIETLDWAGPELNSVRAVADDARKQARALDAERRVSGARSPLHGIPVLVKDNYETRDMTTTAGSKALAKLNTGRDAHAVERLREAGAVILGKTNMHEFAYGITTVGSLFGQTKNPYNTAHNAGGSSGGTGAAIAANFASAGMGSDTCGSIRIPAARNNLVGLRGTQGLSSRRGIIPLSTTQDIGGPLARSTVDLAIMLDATVGPDPQDPETQASEGQIPESYYAALNATAMQGARLGLVPQLLAQDEEDQPTANSVRDNLASLRRLGAEVVEVDLPELAELIDDSWNGHLVIIHDFKWNIGDYLAAVPSAPVRSLDEILSGGLAHDAVLPNLQASASITQRNAPEYVSELQRRQVLRDYLLNTLEQHNLDALIYPSVRRPSTLLGDHQQLGSNCRPSAKSGLPAISVPFAFDNNGLPIGLELLGRPWSEQRLLDLAHSFETLAGMRRVPQGAP